MPTAQVSSVAGNVHHGNSSAPNSKDRDMNARMRRVVGSAKLECERVDKCERDKQRRRSAGQQSAIKPSSEFVSTWTLRDEVVMAVYSKALIAYRRTWRVADREFWKHPGHRQIRCTDYNAT